LSELFLRLGASSNASNSDPRLGGMAIALEIKYQSL
jgi:hypothetical protein